MTKEEEILSQYELDVHYYSKGGRKDILSAMRECAKQQALAFVVFRQDFQREESRKVREEQKRLGGMFTWVGRSDEEIYDQFIESQNNNNQ